MPSIILSDNGVSSGSAGLKSTAASDGALALQTTTSGGTATTAVSIDTSQNVTFAGYANLPNTFGFKNRIINGAMVIDQRNAGASLTPTDGAYSLDRWRFQVSQASKLTVQQRNSVDSGASNYEAGSAPSGYAYSMKVTSSSAYSSISTDYFWTVQFLEGFNTQDLAWGTASAKTITLSFWVKSSLTGAFGGALASYAGSTRTYPFSFTINAANTWEQKTITIAGDTSGTYPATNNGSIGVYFNLGTGSNRQGTANVWSGSDYRGGATGSTSVVGTNGATFYITGVQFEVGSTATSFDFRPYTTELQLCQRYYWRWTANYSSHPITVFQAYSSTAAWGKLFDLPVQMRTTPTASTSGNFGATNAAASSITNFTTTTIAQNTANMLATGAWTGSSGLVAGNATVVVAAASGNYIDASAEL